MPAILPKSREDLEQKLSLLAGVVPSVQIDVVDGRFVASPSWPYLDGSKDGVPNFSDGESLPYLGQIAYDIDLMVSNPEDVAGLWIEAGASRITIHAESSKYLAKTIQELQFKYGHAKDFVPNLISMGLSINTGTELALIEPFLDQIDYVQFMGVAVIGKQGEPFDPRVLRKISEFKKKYPEMTIQVDGGVSLATAPSLLIAGVDRLVIGSALWKNQDIAAEIEKFQEAVQEYGIYS